MIDLGIKSMHINFHEINIYVKNLKVIFNRSLNFRERPPWKQRQIITVRFWALLMVKPHLS